MSDNNFKRHGCQKQFRQHTDLWRHLRASQKPACQAEFNKTFEDNHDISSDPFRRSTAGPSYESQYGFMK